ncbi:MAG TPA: hypothetical protein VMS86_05710, partial [Thermoanaerobaculia bacterium]|nr:hypothetical protein [Thermoanaerobaculia bacterium]
MRAILAFLLATTVSFAAQAQSDSIVARADVARRSSIVARTTAECQIVTPLPSFQNVGQMSPAFLTFEYDATDPTLTGITIRVHWESSQVTIDPSMDLGNVFTGAGAFTVIGPSSVQDDTSDFDSDPSTDKFFTIGWVDSNPPAEFPGTVPQNLFDATFTTDAGFAGTTSVNVSYQSRDLTCLTTPAPMTSATIASLGIATPTPTPTVTATPTAT